MRLMSYCPKCGRTYEDKKFKCSYCGAPLAYAPSTKGPSSFDKILRYKSFVILIAIAIIISMVGAVAQILNAMFWLVLIGVAAGLLFLFLRQRNHTARYNPPSYTDRNLRNDSRRHGHAGRKPSNVIPLRKKRSDKESKGKNNRDV
jgi:uncharacterized protein (DUF983 family)